MKSSLLLTLSLFLSLAVPARAQSYEDALKLGIAAYKETRYEDAVQHFRRAIDYDSRQPIAHLYLATVYTNQYIPGLDTPDNIAAAEQAIEQYRAVLDLEAPLGSKVDSTKGIAYLYLNMKKWKEAKQYYKRASQLNAKDPEPYFSVGVIDWTASYQPRMEARAKLGMKPDAHLDAQIPEQRQLCDELKGKNNVIIEEGITNLQKAIERRPDYDDAMAYMNLMYREKADLECDDLVGRNKDLKTADDWVDLTLAVKKQKTESIRMSDMPKVPNLQ